MNSFLDGMKTSEQSHLEFLEKLIDELGYSLGKDNIPEFVLWQKEQTEELIRKC
tara:strand:- start:132 stop:293 length:162 start_codon:yes stop_codon:yes gene_type:complete